MNQRWIEAEVWIEADGTLVIVLDAGDDLDQIGRVMVGQGKWCRMFYEPTIEQTTMGCENCTYHYPGEPYCSRMGIPVEDDFICRDWTKGEGDEREG